MKRIGILGASGYTGTELLRFLAGHPEIEVAFATGDSMAGQMAAHVYPSLAAKYRSLVYAEYSPDKIDGLDLVFTCLPHGASGHLMREITSKVPHVVDLAADFRLKNASLYPAWYGEEHPDPTLIEEFAFGIPELTSAEIGAKKHVAAAGCHVTAAALALTPLVRAGLIQTTGVVVNTITGVSGAGRVPKPNTHFCTVNEDVNAYGLLNHRHTPEMEQIIGAQIIFTPHLAPMNRGMLATCYAKPSTDKPAPTTESLLATLARAYRKQPFIVVHPTPPSTKATYGTNAAHITARYDERTNTVITVCALDNLGKGASGQALQCANILLGLDQTLGLPTVGVFP